MKAALALILLVGGGFAYFQVGLVEVIGVGDKLAFVRGGKVMRRVRGEFVHPGKRVGILVCTLPLVWGRGICDPESGQNRTEPQTKGEDPFSAKRASNSVI